MPAGAERLETNMSDEEPVRPASLLCSSLQSPAPFPLRSPRRLVRCTSAPELDWCSPLQVTKATAKVSLGSIYTCFHERFRQLLPITYLCVVVALLVGLIELFACLPFILFSKGALCRPSQFMLKPLVAACTCPCVCLLEGLGSCCCLSCAASAPVCTKSGSNGLLGLLVPSSGTRANFRPCPASRSLCRSKCRTASLKGLQSCYS